MTKAVNVVGNNTGVYKSVADYEMETETINNKIRILTTQVDELVNKRNKISEIIKELQNA